MKEYNCPDCEREDSCKGCPRVLERNKDTKIEHIPPYFPDSIIWPKNTSGVPNCCKSCSNHPINGGTGICNCTAPLFDNSSSYKITCNSSSDNTYYIDYYEGR